MPMLSDVLKQDIAQLIALPWYVKCFFSRKLKTALNSYTTQNEPTPQDAWNICNAFFDSWFFQRYVISLFYDFSSSRLGKLFNQLKSADLLSDASAQDNWQTVATHPAPWSVADSLKILHETGLLTGAFAQENRQAVATHQKPNWVAKALKILHEAGLLSGTSGQENRQVVATHPYPLYIAEAFEILHKAGLLSGASGQRNQQMVAAHRGPERLGITYALRVLHKADLLTGMSAQDNWQAVATHQDPYSVVYALKILHEVGLLSGASEQENRQAVVSLPHTSRVTYALERLHEAGLLTSERGQAHFNALLTYSNILLADNTHGIWAIIPAHRLTQEFFNQIIQLAQQHQANPQEARQRFVALVNRDLLRIAAETNTQQAINTEQSTHTASVHASVSQSVIKLLNRYGQAISNPRKLNNILSDMTIWIDSLSTSEPKKAAAQRGFRRIVRNNYSDDVSQVSIQQLLALTWLAIQDKKHAQGSLENLKGLLIEGLYEIQRGYNLSEAGADNGGPDRPICIGGTFNKLMEKLSGQHPDVELIFMFAATASTKFKIIVNEEIVAYLSSLDNLDETERNALNEALNDNSASALFAKIVTQVSERLFNEFAPVFQHDKQSQTFRSLIDSGEYVALSELTRSKLKETLSQKAATATNPQSFFQSQTQTPTEPLHVEPAGTFVEKNLTV